MYAIIRVGHRQFRVRAGTILRITSFLKAEKGKKSIQFPVIAIEEGKGIVLGTPELKEAQVVATVLREGRTKKVLVFKKKRRKGYRRTKGHRQAFMDVEISEIKFPSGKIEKAKLKVKKEQVSAKPKVKAAETKKTKPVVKTKTAVKTKKG